MLFVYSMVYPPKVYKNFRSPRFGRGIACSNANGNAVSLECGTFVEFSLNIVPETKIITDVGYESNGCGYMIAAAENLAERMSGRSLTELHGLDKIELKTELTESLGAIEIERSHCVESALIALKDCLGDFRRRQVQEFVGEKALVCTCFGVSEERIEEVIKTGKADTVDRVGQLCKAGTGCGSCQFLIGEIIDSTLNCE